MVPLNFTNLGFRIQLDKLRVLIRRQNMKILIPDENIQILIRLTDRCMLRRIQERRQVSPEFFSRGIGILHAIKSTGKAILLGKLAEILTERRRILIIEITTTGSGKSRSTPDNYTICRIDLLNQSSNLLLIRSTRLVAQFIRCTAHHIQAIIFVVIHLRFHDKIFIKAHGYILFSLLYIYF